MFRKEAARRFPIASLYATGGLLGLVYLDIDYRVWTKRKDSISAATLRVDTRSWWRHLGGTQGRRHLYLDKNTSKERDKSVA
ncbi:hypothetical protein NDU88_000555 [Pleurodeles waltl]|uniref:Uncharacterized protein n=1 Tax=Pleurodeles waltl TaxID=8319 RepID=A0AAV7P4I7_PLEWA|nr:hypothetical protein NDU88_000555 [Pleurodeles waltl]